MFFLRRLLLLVDGDRRTWNEERWKETETSIVGGFILAAVSASVLILYRVYDKHGRALRYYARCENKSAYVGMTACILISGAALWAGLSSVVFHVL